MLGGSPPFFARLGHLMVVAVITERSLPAVPLFADLPVVKRLMVFLKRGVLAVIFTVRGCTSPAASVPVV